MSKRAEAVVGRGDFQTPLGLAEQVLRFVRERGVMAERILEPTCGSGAFIAAAYATWERLAEAIGLELNPTYTCALAELSARHASFTFRLGDAQLLEPADLRWKRAGTLVICGNLPWVTTDALSRLADAYQLPIRDNPKHLVGLDALTGAGAFDIAERLVLRLIRIAVAERRACLALLVKESVARRVLLFARGQFVEAAVVRIDAQRWFGVRVAACLLYVRFDAAAARSARSVDYLRDFERAVDERWTLESGVVRRATFGLAERVAASTQLRWRHGIKHDAAAVFEFAAPEAGNVLDVRSAYLYPCLTARDLHVVTDLAPARTFMLVPQRTLNDRSIESDSGAAAERAYLAAAGERLARRKSSIYRNKPVYAIFGVGDYTFCPFKAAVAGLYTVPRFRFVGPVAGKPIVLGDTSYFLPCATASDAAIVVALGNAPTMREEIGEMVFAGKRPITKRVLDSLNFGRALARSSADDLYAQVVAIISAWRGETLVIPTKAAVAARAAELLGGARR